MYVRRKYWVVLILFLLLDTPRGIVTDEPLEVVCVGISKSMSGAEIGPAEDGV